MNQAVVAALSQDEPIDAVVIGAGFAGLYMVYRLRQNGFSVRGLEKGDDVGGTWYWNRYPGARCDSEIMYYSYSFLPDVEQEWPLEERYPGQPQILRYLEHVADRLDLRRNFTFGAHVTAVEYDELENVWMVRTRLGQSLLARYVITAVGCLSAPNWPEIPGAASFRGPILHTGLWPHEPVDFDGKRVGIIGTGASGIQTIPVIARQAARLTVFQRTAQFTIPAGNGPLDPQFVALWRQNYPEWRRRGRWSDGGAPYPPSTVSALDVSEVERQAAYRIAWSLGGGFMFTRGTFSDLLVDEEANRTAADFVRSKIGEIVHDSQVAEKLMPHGYPLGTKRLPLDTGYYDTYNRPNVALVDVQRTPIAEITPWGIRTTDENHEVDMIIYATGFDALTGPLKNLGVRGRNGLALADAWKDCAQTYLGLAMPRFPNLFTITGPGSPSVLGNMPVSIEQHVEWIGDCLEYLRAHDIGVIEASSPATVSWSDHVQQIAHQTLYPKAASFYMGSNVPGKPRQFLPYLGGIGHYRAKCAEIAARGYEGFTLSGAQSQLAGSTFESQSMDA